MGKTLVAYFSRPGQNYVSGGIVGLPRGNTEVLAEAIADALGADTYRIEPAVAYPEDYYACTDVAKRELVEGARPELAAAPPSLEDYDVIILGYPNWWGTCPMAVRTFLDACDLAGKVIAPLCTNEGSGMGSSVTDLRRAYPQATVAEGLAIAGHDAAASTGRAVAWAQRVVS
ncbi:flavodoxin [Olsenella profusa]|uniref:NAD(P)H-dependent oxidoreductase n=1 Tax=Olsenella profusa TaxID=138595 RepID=A0ABS2F249_9ACTN|nr:flavodoxin [Olsenella profusa]MBM6775071.1 NAD(P)H-dependent oxidoreductase [Olsenella profusa]